MEALPLGNNSGATVGRLEHLLFPNFTTSQPMYCIAYQTKDNRYDGS